MPELPEVQTTVDGLNKTVKGKKIVGVWTDYKSAFHKGKENVKNPEFFIPFKKSITGATIVRARRRGKNILIELSVGKTILIHMKMTGHLMYGKYKKTQASKDPWKPVHEGPLTDPFNKWIHLVFTLENNHHLVFSDLRKFATVTLIPTGKPGADEELRHLGPEALGISVKNFVQLFEKERRPIKQVLMDQEVLAGIGNIYSDEMLWLAGIHPLSIPRRISVSALKALFKSMHAVLEKGINFGGDSTSDYRNIHGERGSFQHKHNAYQKTGTRCTKHGCKGTIKRIVIAQRSGHFCSAHQKLFS
jgi:formamidopyrimidine-DNA glycosylase